MSKKIELHCKEDFQSLLIKIVRPLIPYYSEGKAGVNIGETAACYGQNIVEMEAFSRPLWGLVPFWTGGGENKEFEEIYRRGLVSGTNPKGAEYWGGFYNGDQRFVEMAAIAYGLILTPEKLWNPLCGEEKDNLANWLSGINQYQLPVCNWIFFAILVNIALKKCGREYDKEKLEYYLASADSFYLGDGWYQDGVSEQKDYYVSFAIHYYSLFYAKIMEVEDPRRSRVFKERAYLFAQQFIYWFDEDGAGLAYGRSLTYRFSQVAFFSACLMADVYPFSVGQMKGLIVRHLLDWFANPIFDHAGILTIGYSYPNLIMAEMYNAPGSPYWSLKTFALLMLPDEHPFWEAEEEKMPELDNQKVLPYAEMLIQRYPHHVSAFVPGKHAENDLGHATEKYAKFVYDTRFAFSISKSNDLLRDAAPDSMLAFVINDMVFVRRNCKEYEVSDNQIVSKWSPYQGITVETTLIPTEEGHIRRHRIESEIKCIAYDCGYAVETCGEGDQAIETEEGAFAKNTYSSCLVQSKSGNGKGTFIGCGPNTSLAATMTRLPAIEYQIIKGNQSVETEIKADYNSVLKRK